MTAKVDFNRPRSFLVSKQPFVVLVADLNKDGKQDLIVSSQVKGVMSEFLGNGDGTFQAARVCNAGGGDYESVVSTDFNGDGKADIVYYDRFDLAVFVQLGNGDGTFKTPQAVVSSLFLWGVPSPTFNHDGIPDLAVDEAEIFSWRWKRRIHLCGPVRRGSGFRVCCD